MKRRIISANQGRAVVQVHCKLYSYIGVENTEQIFSANIRQNQNSTKIIEHPKIVKKRNIIYQKDI